MNEDNKFDIFNECQKCGSRNISMVGKTPKPSEQKLGYLVYECKACKNIMISDDADQLSNYKGKFNRTR